MRVGADFVAQNRNATVRVGTGYIRWKAQEKELGGERAAVQRVLGGGGANGENFQRARLDN